MGVRREAHASSRDDRLLDEPTPTPFGRTCLPSRVTTNDEQTSSNRADLRSFDAWRTSCSLAHTGY